jgi:protoporphyrinogen oxidase
MLFMSPSPIVGIIGAGPAGLSCAYKLREHGIDCKVFEQDVSYVGGISRTVRYKGYRFDIGGHRFFSKSDVVENFWASVLKDQLVERRRLSRIYFNDRFFNYPLSPYEAFRKLGPIYSFQCFFSYLKAKLFPVRNVRSFEDWVINNFGRKLYLTFFKTYTEKVWGIPCSEISADWAAQRIKGLSFYSLLKSLFQKQKGTGGNKKVIKTLIDRFRYPEFGPGQFWETIQQRLDEAGKTVHMGHDVVGIQREAGRLKLTCRCKHGGVVEQSFDQLISTMPVIKLVAALGDGVPDEVRRAALSLKYRDFLIVALVVDAPDLFPDNWIYIHDSTVNVGRIQNFKNWSPSMVPDPAKSCLGMEFFCDRGDALWSRSDADLIQLAEVELRKLGLVSAHVAVEDGSVIRVPKAYPVYDDHYKAHMEVIRVYLEREFPEIQLVGRNGMHRYNNQDHAIMTGFLAAENIVRGDRHWDLWCVNQDASYHEEVKDVRETAMGGTHQA